VQWLERPRASVAELARTGWSDFRDLLLLLSANQAKILKIAAIMRRRKHALFGAHARNAYVAHEPRTTADIDLLVPDAAAAKRAGEAILAVVPGIRTRATPFGMVQVIDKRTSDKIADLVPADEPLTTAAIATARRRPVPALGALRVPPREIIIAMKLDSASDPRRRKLRAAQDAIDAMSVRDSGAIDEAALAVALSMVPARARRLYAKLKKSLLP
jgi:hypothetical protein